MKCTVLYSFGTRIRGDAVRNDERRQTHIWGRIFVDDIVYYNNTVQTRNNEYTTSLKRIREKALENVSFDLTSGR